MERHPICCGTRHAACRRADICPADVRDDGDVGTWLLHGSWPITDLASPQHSAAHCSVQQCRFRELTHTWSDAIRDAAIAYAIGIVSSTAVLTAVGVLQFGQPFHEVVGKIAVQAVPASIGALLARSQLNGDTGDNTEDDDDPIQEGTGRSYAGEMFLMAIGALFLGLNVAPTEEMILLSYKMTPWHVLAVVALSSLSCTVSSMPFPSRADSGDRRRGASLACHHPLTLPGYVMSLLVSAYALWTFERFGDAAILADAHRRHRSWPRRVRSARPPRD